MSASNTENNEGSSSSQDRLSSDAGVDKQGNHSAQAVVTGSTTTQSTSSAPHPQRHPKRARTPFLVAGFVMLLVSAVAMFFAFEKRNTCEKCKRMVRKMQEWRGRYEVDEPGCRIPYIDPDDGVILQDWFSGDDTTCSPQPRYFLSTVARDKKNCLVVNESILLQDYNTRPDQIRCTYQTIEARLDRDPWINEYLAKEAKELHWDHCFDEPYALVECNTRSYVQTLFMAKDVSSTKQNTSMVEFIPEKRLSVLVLGVDAVSRANFLRLMKSTLEKIQRIFGNDTFDLRGFNKVGANSAPNQIPFLTGKRFRHEEHVIHNEFFEEFASFVWENFSEAGYATFFDENMMKYGLFNHPRRRGFRDMPVDYWPRPLALKRDEYRHKGSLLGPVSYLCIGNEHVATTMMNYWIQIQRVSTSPTFSYLWFAETTHDSVTGGKNMDSILPNFFDEFERLDSANNTIIFFLSDHGYRMAPYRETPLGALEDMLPLAFVLLPRRYRTLYPEDVKRLGENSYRLTTPYDIHATLMDLAVLSRNQRVEFTDLGQSLLSTTISPLRTCEAAHIDPQYCACYTRDAVDASIMSLSGKMAEATLAKINQILKDNNVARICVAFDAPRVLRIVAMRPSAAEAGAKFVKMIVGSNIEVVRFEAVFKIVNETFSMIGFPDRLDRYSPHSRCVELTPYEKYCYCK